MKVDKFILALRNFYDEGVLDTGTCAKFYAQATTFSWELHDSSKPCFTQKSLILESPVYDYWASQVGVRRQIITDIVDAANRFKTQQNKKLYCIVRGNRAVTGTSVASNYLTLEEAKVILDFRITDVLLEGKLYWPGNRVKGVTLPNALPNGSNTMIYADYDQEFFSKQQMMVLRERAIVDFDALVEMNDTALSGAAVTCDAADEIYLALLSVWGDIHEPAIKAAVEKFYLCKL